MLGIPYQAPPPAAPRENPCRTCAAHGPYCADACPLLDAWLHKQAREAGARPTVENSSHER